MVIGGIGGLLIAAAMAKPRLGGFIVGALLGIFGWLLIVVWKVDAKRARSDARPATNASAAPPLRMPPATAEKTCPRCAETVKAAAKMCRFCQYEFGPDETIPTETFAGYCDQCGAKIPTQTRFCAECGSRAPASEVGEPSAPRPHSTNISGQVTPAQVPDYRVFQSARTAEVVTKDSAPLLNEARMSARSLGRISPGVSIALLGETTDYYFVEVAGQLRGWLPKSSVRVP